MRNRYLERNAGLIVKWSEKVSVTIEELLMQIEDLRKELVNISVGRAFTDQDVLTVSQNLDDVLNEYQKLVGLNKEFC